MLFFGVITESLALLSDYYHYSYHHACFDYFAYCGSGLTHYEYEDLIPAFLDCWRYGSCSLKQGPEIPYVHY